MMVQATATTDTKQRLFNGAFLNFLGTSGRGVLFLLQLMIITRLFGPKVVGSYVVALNFIDASIHLVVTGFLDGTIFFQGKCMANQGDEIALHRVLVTGIRVCLILSAILLIGDMCLGEWLAQRLFKDQAVIHVAFHRMIWGIPLFCLANLLVAATKAHLTMFWDNLINGLVRPLAIIMTSVTAALISPDIAGLAGAYPLAAVITLIAAIFGFAQVYSWRKLLPELARAPWHRGLVRYALPQNINMTFTQFFSSLDIIMLPVLGTPPELVAFYTAGAQVVRNIRQIRIIFTNALAPFISQFHARKDGVALRTAIGSVVQWTMDLAVPALFAVAILRPDLLLLFHKSYQGNTIFMLILLIVPFLNCSFGTAAVAVVMTGYVFWNLFNTVSSMALNALLCWLFIRWWGLAGAALATVASALFLTIVQLLQMYLVVGVPYPWKSLKFSLLGGLPLALELIMASLTGWQDHLWQRLLALLLGLALFTLIRRMLEPGWPKLGKMMKKKIEADPAVAEI
jgi:O-antigen/teichoic acid export membrane protein